jgi:hypothetical protein
LASMSASGEKRAFPAPQVNALSWDTLGCYPA